MSDKNIIIKPQNVIILAAAALSLSLCGCKGRHADDMVPTGDTVEVVINTPATSSEFQDSTFINDSINNEN